MTIKLNRIEENKIIFVLINLIVGAVFFVFNVLTPLIGDDISYSYIGAAGLGSLDRPITCFADVITSQKAQYMTWGGRSIINVINQSFLLTDKMVFNIANTLVFVLMVLMVYRLANRKKISNSFLLIEYILLWIAIPGVGSTLFYQTISVNYLWGTTIVLGFLFPYIRLFEAQDDLPQVDINKSKASSVLMTIAMLPLGVIAGWTIEAGASMMLAGIGIVGIYQIVKKQSIKVWEITGLVGALGGFALLILAPGNYVRAQRVASHGGLITELGYRLARETYYMLLDMGIVLFVAILLFFLVRDKLSFKQMITKYKVATIMFVLAIIGVYVMTATGAYAERVITTPIVFMLVAVGYLFKDFNICKNRAVISVICIAGCVFVCLQAAVGMYKIRGGGNLLNIRTEYTDN